MYLTIAISYFHRKVGPMVFYHYPEGDLKEEEKIRISDVMDSAFEEGFFTHSFDKVETNQRLTSMNYYFEIFSKWARGQREMLMISAIIDENIDSDVEYEIIGLCIDFAGKLKNYQEIYKAFYNEEEPQFSPDEAANIKKYAEMVKLWVKDLYWAATDVTREKTEEENIATTMAEEGVYELIKFLSNGPVALDDLEIWFDSKFPKLSLEKKLEILEKEKIIFINDIGVENYVLLVKNVRVARIPPDCIITMMLDEIQEDKIVDDFTELAPEFTTRVQTFFDTYEPNLQDSINLFNLVSNPRVYNVLSQLRTGPIEKSKLENYFHKEHLEDFFKILDILKDNKIIDEFEHEGKTIILLITDIQFTTSFPEYLSALIPKETKVQVAKSYSLSRPQENELINTEKIKSSLDTENIRLDFEGESEIGIDALRELNALISKDSRYDKKESDKKKK